MPKSKNIPELISLKRKGLIEGRATFSLNENRKDITIEASWKGKYLNLEINIDRPYPGNDFVPCKLNKSKFLSAVMRYSNFNFYGTKSEYSDHLLGSEIALKLMTQRNACIELSKRSLNYNCRIKDCTEKRLKFLISLSIELSEELDAL